MKLTALLLLALNLAIAGSAGFYLYLCKQAAAGRSELDPRLMSAHESLARTSRALEMATENRDRWEREGAIFATELHSLEDSIEAGEDAGKRLESMVYTIEPDLKRMYANLEQLDTFQKKAFERLNQRHKSVLGAPKAVGTIEQFDAAEATIRITEKDEDAVLEAGQVVTLFAK